MNRVEKAIATIGARVATLPATRQAEMHKSMETSFSDLVEYQNLQALAHASGYITTDEAMTLYRIYGGEAPSPDSWNKLSLTEKIVGTKLAEEMLQWRLRQKKNPAYYPSCGSCGALLVKRKQRRPTDWIWHYVDEDCRSVREPKDETSGQDRESYSDTQDRESYTVSYNPTYAEDMQKKFGVPFDPKHVKSSGGFRFGQRVRQASEAEAAMWSGVPRGAMGRVWAIRGIGGLSVSPDPLGKMIFVRWDKYGDQSVWKSALEKIGA